MKKIIILITLLIFLTSCSLPYNKSATSDKTTQTASNAGTTEADKNNKSLTNLISADKEIMGDRTSDSIIIIPLNLIDNEKFFAIIKSKYYWVDGFWFINYDGKTITKKLEIGACEGSIYKYDLVEISQGKYLQLYIAHNTGNGGTILLNTTTLKVDYTFNGTVDRYQEAYVGDSVVKQFKLPAIRNGLTNYGYSFIFNGDYLTSSYSDINKDGRTDVVFYGIKELVADDDDNTKGYFLPLHLYYIKEVYLFDSSKNEFFFNEKMSFEKLLR